jgi:hypothetical protein
MLMPYYECLKLYARQSLQDHTLQCTYSLVVWQIVKIIACQAMNV